MHRKIWQTCLKIIEKQLPAQSVETWFTPIVPLTYENSVLTIQVPSYFFFEWIEENYLSVLKKAVHAAIGPSGKLAYAIAVDQGATKPSAQHMHLPLQASIGESMPSSSVSCASSEQTSQHTSLSQTMGSLHPRYTFDNYVAGSCNCIVRDAAQSVAQQVGRTVFNPLVFYGGVGLGKTHLMQAIAHQLGQTHAHLKTYYLSGDQFVSQFVGALRKRSMQHFCDLYFSADVLLIDDIQFLREKHKTQEILFHIFNQLHQKKKQLVFTSDMLPAELEGMHERLISRLKWGVTLRIDPTTYETRRKILESRAVKEGITLSQEVLDYLAQAIDTNVRELEGALISLLAHVTFLKTSPSVSLAKDIVSRVIHKKSLSLSMPHIQQAVSNYFRLKPEDLLAKSRKKEVVIARQVAMYLSKHHMNYSLSAIGYYFGKRNHSTVLHAMQAIEKLEQNDPHIKDAISSIRAEIIN